MQTNSMRTLSAAFWVLVAAAAAGGCSNQKSPPLTPAAGTTATVDVVYSDVALARCNHEEACGRVGEDREYVSREHCMNAMKAGLREKLSDCKGGFEEDDVRECIGAIEAQSCSEVPGELESIDACEPDDLCD